MIGSRNLCRQVGCSQINLTVVLDAGLIQARDFTSLM